MSKKCDELNDNVRLKESFRQFIIDYRKALAILMGAVDELEVISKEIVQNKTDCSKNKGGNNIE